MEIKVRPRITYTEGREMFDRPEGIVDCAEEIDGVLRSWKEFVPSSYDGSTAVPLVVTLHGGSSARGKNNQRADQSTAWASVAEREGFIVVYPQSLTPEHTWSAWEDFSDTSRTKALKDDILYLNLLLEIILNKYQIDRERMYLHGQSFGDVMSTFYLLNSPGHPFAAAATLSGPVGAEHVIRENGAFRYGKECALPVVRTHGSKDLAMPMGRFQHMDDTVGTFDLMKKMRSENCDEEAIAKAKLEYHQLVNIALWKHCNGCEAEPVVSVRGRYNAVTYPGKYDFHFYMVEQGGHGPSMDMADFIWTYFLSGYKKVNGQIVKIQPERVFVPDREAVAVADHSAYAYVDNHRISLSGKVRELDGIFYIPAECIGEIYPQLTVEIGAQEAVLRQGEQWMQVSACNQTFVWNNHLEHGDRTLIDGEVLLISLRQISRYFYGKKAKCRDGVCYFSEYDGVLTYDFAYLVRQILGTEKVLSAYEMRQRADRILSGAPQPGM